MSKSAKDFLRFFFPMLIGLLITDFVFRELRIDRSGLMFTENFNLKIALAHGFSVFALFIGAYWLLGKLPVFKKDIIPASSPQDQI
ncbi:hypothetical protein H8L32_23220 [Undibacterium sp. CY18W]|uniref:Uncharacterized protein n=1 Tax=Undibacterium hunanense TaxID=2762292 RepID=A0ABR6ZX86_9BURK|nr:hypothetical protein [Undibacterium hunanense]MBC3920394.1 hypothetical protein [Undibacterium hunanense]